ncbi:uncharacterized protein K489DRAFT_412414 [Dissoconium aciculare CBS 342.82]|uniref:Uncharacterized protein n=1 Tax=Dissoconium aciculare CBS 342.82 TaxID=1314786 RepID=A0A6J3LVA9_9PEZI|nr:uncharacterized protein K489DRAFT_412414 [Dissoconium aciculare CBS 342.82]KAF1819701.1 hypothetical protein K489DRAFT_412414 [Dissoconium aciculare CBS 342.82]
MSPPNSLAIACDLLGFVWRHDEFVYRDFRMQAQLALSLLLIHFYGLDTSELVGDYSQSRPKAIQWGDIEFLSLPRSSGTYCTIAARLCITKRLDTGRKDVHEYQADRAYCPVSLLIALALDDGVFTEIQTTEQFAKEYASAVQKPLLDRLAIRDEKLKLPVIRRYCAPAKISLTNALSLQQLTLLLKEVDLRRGTSDLIPLIAALEDVLLKHSDNDAVSSDDGQFCPSENVPLTETQIMLSALPTEADLMSFAKLGPLAGTPQKYPTRNARTAWVYDRPRTAMLALLDAQAYGRLVTLPEMIAALQPRFAAPRWHYPSPMEDDTPICSELKLQPALSQLELYMCKTRTFLNKAITVQMKEAYRSCMWTGCQFDTGPEYLETIAFHISDHIAESSGICRWMQFAPQTPSPTSDSASPASNSSIPLLLGLITVSGT